MKTIIRNSAITVFLTASFTLNGMNNDLAYAIKSFEAIATNTKMNLQKMQLVAQRFNHINHPVAIKTKENLSLYEKLSNTVLTSIEGAVQTVNNPVISKADKNRKIIETRKTILDTTESLNTLQNDFQTMLNNITDAS